MTNSKLKNDELELTTKGSFGFRELLHYWGDPWDERYIYLHEWLRNVGKYTSPMDPMGYLKKHNFDPLGRFFLAKACQVLKVKILPCLLVVLLMAEILHQLIGSLSHDAQGFIHPRWLAGFQPSTVCMFFKWHI